MLDGDATALAGHHFNVLIESWLGGVPIQVGERWLKQPTERQYTVPPKIKWVLAALAIRHVMRNDCEFDRVLALNVADVLAWSRRQAPSAVSQAVHVSAVLRRMLVLRVRVVANNDEPAVAVQVPAAHAHAPQWFMSTTW